MNNQKNQFQFTRHIQSCNNIDMGKTIGESMFKGKTVDSFSSFFKSKNQVPKPVISSQGGGSKKDF